MAEQWRVTRDGKQLATFESESEAFAYLLRIQPMSTDWAIRHEGYQITGPLWNGYANEQSYMFEVQTANTRDLYEAIRDYAADCLRRVPNMTPQTLGANIKLVVRGWVDDAQNGRPAYSPGWGPDHPDISRRSLLDLAGQVGDFSRVSEDDIGESWLDLFRDDLDRCANGCVCGEESDQ